MKQNPTKSLKWLTGVTILVGATNLMMSGCQTCGCFFGYPVAQPAVWIDGIKYFQGAIAIFRFLGAATIFGCIIAFLINSIKALNDGLLFPKKNVAILFATAAASFVFLFCDTNMSLVFGERMIQLGFVEILVPVIISAFAIIYDVAVKVSKENRLTV